MSSCAALETDQLSHGASAAWMANAHPVMSLGLREEGRQGKKQGGRNVRC